MAKHKAEIQAAKRRLAVGIRRLVLIFSAIIFAMIAALSLIILITSEFFDKSPEGTANSSGSWIPCIVLTVFCGFFAYLFIKASKVKN